MDMRFAWAGPCLLAASLTGAFCQAQDPATPQVAAKTEGPPPGTLPDPRTLMLDVEHNQASAEAVSRDYTYRVQMRNEQLRSDGSVKKTITTDAQSFTIDGVRVNKVYARDGKPLTPDEEKKEDEAVDKTVARAKQHRDQRTSKGQPTDAQGDVVITASRILELGQFSNLRAGEYNGRAVWLVDYAGDPHAKTKNEFESVIRDLTGTAWIDQKDHVLVAAHGEFHKDFKIGAGLLVNIKQGTSFDYRASKVDGTVWLLDTFDAKGSLRYLLLIGFSGRIHVHASDYKKFRTSSRIIPSNRVIGPDGQPLPEQPAGGAETPPPGTPAPAPTSPGTPPPAPPGGGTKPPAAGAAAIPGQSGSGAAPSAPTPATPAPAPAPKPQTTPATPPPA